MTFNLPTQKQLSLWLRRSLTCRDSYWPIIIVQYKSVWIFAPKSCSWCKYDPPRWHNYRCVDMRHDTTWVIRSGIQCRMRITYKCPQDAGDLISADWRLNCYLKHCPWLLETLFRSRVINDYITQMSLVSVRHRDLVAQQSSARDSFQCNTQRCTEIFWKVSKITYRNNCKTLMQNI